MGASQRTSLCNALSLQNTCSGLLGAGGEDSPLAHRTWSLRASVLVSVHEGLSGEPRANLEG